MLRTRMTTLTLFFFFFFFFCFFFCFCFYFFVCFAVIILFISTFFSFLVYNSEAVWNILVILGRIIEFDEKKCHK